MTIWQRLKRIITLKIGRKLIMKYISMLSGGQDSTAMTVRLLELGEPLDYIIFSDTGLEHEEMYEYIDKLDAFFQRRYNMKITRLYPKHDFEHWVFGKMTKGEHEGKTRGTPIASGMCWWRREAKQYPFERWIKENDITDFIQYNGFVYGEFERIKNSPNHVKAPLAEWGWREEEVQQYLRNMQMENPLYRHFTRTGCAVCPKQSEASKYMLYKHYPEKWKYMKDVENKLNTDENRIGFYTRWHDKLTIDQLEQKFKQKDKQQTFTFSDEPLADCFCII